MTRTRGTARRRSERGAAVVEFSLVLPVLALLVFGTIQYGYYFFASQSASAAARDAARRVAVGECTADSDLTAYVASKLSSVTANDLQVTRTYDPDATIGNMVTIQVRFTTMDLNFPLIPVPHDGEVTRAFDSRVENLDSGSCG